MTHGRKTVIIPLYINILTIFFVLITSAVGIVVLYNQHMNSRSALDSARLLMAETGSTILERTRAVFEPAFMSADTFSFATDIGEKPNLLTQPLAPMFIRTLEQNPGITSIYIGYADGDFFLISTLKNRPEIRKAIHAPEKAMWYTQAIFHRPDNCRYTLRKYLDKDFSMAGSHLEKNSSYDPRERPWYLQSIISPHPELSDIYIYAFSQEPGVTVARRFDAEIPGVVGLDISLASLSKFLDSQRVGKQGKLVMFEPSGQILAHPDANAMLGSRIENGKAIVAPATIEELEDPVLNELFRTFLSGGKKAFANQLLTVGKMQYMGRIDTMPDSLGRPVFLGMAVPMDEFTGPIVAAGHKSMMASFLILLAYVPLIIWVSRRITKPLNEIMLHVERVRQFRLNRPIRVHTHVAELHRLSKAMETMRTALRSFGKYIPRTLVKNMITLGIRPELGGERRELTLFFSDIQDFTTMAETMPPEELTTSVSGYFQEMGHEISQGGGTIDKYIGDAVMAFWNAPADQPEHAAMACQTALRCRHVVHEINERRIMKGLPPLHTRFGLHTDDAIVGNVGSADRMNYTAMGAAVNLASRIEGLNKYCRTEILASETTVQKGGGRFLFRIAGKVQPKGVTKPVLVYELMGLRPEWNQTESIPADMLADPQREQYVTRWEEAMTRFMQRDFPEAEKQMCDLLKENPEDGLVAVYCDLTRQYQQSPPPPGWDGTIFFTRK